MSKKVPKTEPGYGLTVEEIMQAKQAIKCTGCAYEYHSRMLGFAAGARGGDHVDGCLVPLARAAERAKLHEP